MRKSKMTITVWGCVCIFLIAALVIVPAAQAGGKPFKYRIINRTAKMEWGLVPDVEKHVVGVLERRGVGIFEGEIFEKDETAAQTAWVTFDLIKGVGSIQGYILWTFKDGSTYIGKIQGTKTLDTVKGTGEIFKGTGRFEGIKGRVSFSGKYVTRYTKDETKADAIMDATGTYTLPKK